jgi:hypothetical protein
MALTSDRTSCRGDAATRPAPARHSSTEVSREKATGTLLGVDDSPEIYENMRKALAILTAWNESGDGDLSLVERTTTDYIEGHTDPEAKMAEAVALISGLVSLGGRMLVQLAHSTELSEDELLRIMGQRIAYRTA